MLCGAAWGGFCVGGVWRDRGVGKKGRVGGGIWLGLTFTQTGLVHCPTVTGDEQSFSTRGRQCLFPSVPGVFVLIFFFPLSPTQLPAPGLLLSFSKYQPSGLWGERAARNEANFIKRYIYIYKWHQFKMYELTSDFEAVCCMI